MKSRLALLGLGPLLLAQGYYVRRMTPRLAEPAGERSGIDGSGAALRLLVVGDSAAAGVGVETQAEALSGQLVAALAPEFRVSWRLLATTGHTTRDVLARLEAEAPEAFDVAVTSTGVNDVTGQTPPKLWLAQQEQLVALLRSRFQARQVLLSSIPPMQRFPALPMPLGWYLGTRAELLNRSLGAWVQRDGGCEFVDEMFPMDPGLTAADGFHPGAAAYAIWAKHLAERIRRRWQR